MSIKAGDTMPSGAFGVMTGSGPGAMTTDGLFAGKKLVLVSVPGADRSDPAPVTIYHSETNRGQTRMALS